MKKIGWDPEPDSCGFLRVFAAIDSQKLAAKRRKEFEKIGWDLDPNFCSFLRIFATIDSLKLAAKGRKELKKSDGIWILIFVPFCVSLRPLIP